MRLRLRALVLALTVVGAAACDGDEDVSEVTTHTGVSLESRPLLRNGRVILVTIDGVRWQDVFLGIDPERSSERGGPEVTMPRTRRLAMDRGVALGAGQGSCGVVRTVGGSNVSMPGYIEIFTGARTSCRNNECARVTRPTVFDEVASAIGGVATSIGSWDVLEKTVTSGTDRVGVTAGTHPWVGPRPENATDVPHMVAERVGMDPSPGGPGYRPDAYTAEIALEYLRSEQPTLMHIGLVDTDEWAHKDDYARYLAALRRADDVVGAISDQLDATGEASRTTVILAADHGRAQNFKEHGFMMLGAERSWVIAFGGGIAKRGVACPKRDILLTDIAPTIRTLVGLPPDLSDDAGRPIEEIAPPEPGR